jgi:nitrogen fixation protein
MNVRNTTKVMVATTTTARRQHLATTVVMTLPGAGPKGMLEAAHELLCNPLGLGASPSAAEQWHHDVDQLIVVAINTPLHGGRCANHSGWTLELSAVHSRTPTVPRMAAVSVPTADLWAEHECRRSGEDGRITNECHRERRRNLDGDFSAANTTPVGQAAHTPASSGSGGVCMALA